MKRSRFSLPEAEKWIEDLLFQHRAIFLTFFVVLTVLAGWIAKDVKIDTTLEKQLPLNHPFVETALGYRDKIPGLNSIQIVVETQDTTIWTPGFLKVLYDVTQDVYYLPGIDRTSVASMWTPNTRIIESTEGAVEARDLIPSSVSADKLTEADVSTIRNDAFRGGFRGQMFSLDGRAAMILAAIQESAPGGGGKTDLFAVAKLLESNIRKKNESDKIIIRIIGFAPFVGEIAREAEMSIFFFGIASLVVLLTAWIFTRSWHIALLTAACSLVSVVWMLGIIAWFGIPLSPLGLIVPFLTYAIGVSHGVQQSNQFMMSRVNGATGEQAARIAFRVLAAPGGFALGTCVCGFLALTIVPIPLVRELAVVAAIGVGLKFVSNLVLLPLALSTLRFSEVELSQQNAAALRRERVIQMIAADAHPWPAAFIVVIALGLAATAIATTTRSIGDLTRGAPELWANARFNVDTAAVTKNFNINTDLFVIAVEAPPDSCIDYRTMALVEDFTQHMRLTSGVKSVMSLPEASRFVYAVVQEGNLKWRVLAKDPQTLALTTGVIPSETGLLNKDCTLLTIAAYLEDHRDITLRNVSASAASFVNDPNNKLKGVSFHLATGNAAILAAMNETIADAELPAMGFALFATIALVFAAFRDWRAVVACCTPLVMATIFGHWFMSTLGMGLKISTLPVLVIATGIGVDYAFYLHNRLMVHLREGVRVDEAYIAAMHQRGAAIIFTGLVLATGALTWSLSGLKFQADMGLLLGFMFLVNMILAVTVLPALTVLIELAFPHKHSLRAQSQS